MMKRFGCLFLAAPFLAVTVRAYEKGNQPHMTESIPVYITDTGDCYHRYECEYLHSRKGAKLEEVFMYFRPCSFCNPPVVEWDPNEMCFFAVDVLTSAKGASFSRIVYVPETNHPIITPAKELDQAEEQASAAQKKLERLEKKVQVSQLLALFVGIPCMILGIKLEKKQWEREYLRNNNFNRPRC